MEVTNITSKTKLNSIIGRVSRAQFLQSYEWGEFQKAIGRKVWRLGTGEDAVTVIKYDLPFGKSYLYIPRTIMVNDQWSMFDKELKNIAQQENSIFIKIELADEIPVPAYAKASAGRQPQTTLYLDLSKSEEEILSAMHQKTRYNIRLAEKHGVTVKESKNINEFLTLNRETTTRDKFKSHPDEYYRKMFKTLQATQASSDSSIKLNTFCKLFTAYYKGKTLASNLTIFFADTATYLHGASSDQHRNLMAPHLLQWEIIKHAKQHGYKWYDFWGINPTDEKSPNFKSSWQGITRFKRGFVSDITGKEVTYPGCFDLPISKFWYTLYKTVKLLKK